MTGETRTERRAEGLSADQSYVARVTRSSGSNFYYSFFFLPKAQRDAIHALYAFCREVDDSVDRCADPDEAARRVAFWREELEACYGGRPSHPISRSLGAHLHSFPIRKTDLSDVIDGVEMDIVPRRYRSFADLSIYCHRVASAVGLSCIEIFGYGDPAARDYAVRLGLAFQMTNILRDVKSDAERGRIYLPTVDLERFSCPEEDLRADAPSDAFERLMQFETGRARDLFSRAQGAFPASDRRTLFAAEIMGAIYEAILAKISQRAGEVLRGRVGISRPRKIAIAARCFLKARAAPRGAGG